MESVGPLFRCLPSNPKARIELALPKSKHTGMQSRAFEDAMLGSGMQSWEDCRTLVSIYNRAVMDHANAR